MAYAAWQPGWLPLLSRLPYFLVAVSWIGRRRLHASAAAVFATLMLVVLALIARAGLTGATGRMVFGLELLLWSVTLSGFPLLLMRMAAIWRL